MVGNQLMLRDVPEEERPRRANDSTRARTFVQR